MKMQHMDHSVEKDVYIHIYEHLKKNTMAVQNCLKECFRIVR